MINRLNGCNVFFDDLLPLTVNWSIPLDERWLMTLTKRLVFFFPLLPLFLRGIIFNNAFLVVGPPPSISPNILRAKIDSGIVLIGGRGKGYTLPRSTMINCACYEASSLRWIPRTWRATNFSHGGNCDASLVSSRAFKSSFDEWRASISFRIPHSYSR